MLSVIPGVYLREPQEGGVAMQLIFFHAALFENIWRTYNLNSFYVVHELYVAISIFTSGRHLVIPTPGLSEGEGENVYLHKAGYIFCIPN